jgi:hypothetical protein
MLVCIGMALFVAVGGVASRGPVIEQGLWPRGRPRDHGAAESSPPDAPTFRRGYRANAEQGRIGPPCLGRAPRAARLAFVGMVALPWTWPLLWCYSVMVTLADGLAALAWPWPLFGGLALPLLTIPAVVLARRSARAFSACDPLAASRAGRPCAVACGAVASGFAIPTIIAVFALPPSPWSLVSAALAVLSLAGVVHAVILWRTATHPPADW